MSSEYAPKRAIVAGNLLCSPDTCFSRCAAILVYCSVRDWTRFLRHRIRKYPDSPIHTLSDSFSADLFFSTLESGFIFFRIRCRIRKYPDTCGRGLSGMKRLVIFLLQLDGMLVHRRVTTSIKVAGTWVEEAL